ncbi:MAG: glycosyltransferase [Hydrogenobacter sp.]
MKVIDVTPYFHSKSGGIRRYLLEKSKYLSDKPVEHAMILPGKERKEYYIYSTKVYQIPSFPIPMSGGYRFFSSLKCIKDIIRLEKPDIVELQGTYLPITSLLSEDYRLVAFYHADVRTDASLIPIPEKFRKKLIDYTIIKKLSKADIVITPSKKQEEFLRNYYLENVITVNLGVDTETFNPSKRNPYINTLLGVKENTFKVIYVGRLSPEKNIDILLEIISLLDPTFFHFIIAGDGPLRRRVENFVKRQPNVTYLGYVSDIEWLAQLYASSDLFLSASYSETYGLSFLEAQACGCILVAPDMDLETQPFKEFLVKDLKVESFYEAIVRAVNCQSFNVRQALSQHIRENFSWDKTFSKLLDIYNGILSRVI